MLQSSQWLGSCPDAPQTWGMYWFVSRRTTKRHRDATTRSLADLGPCFAWQGDCSAWGEEMSGLMWCLRVTYPWRSGSWNYWYITPWWTGGEFKRWTYSPAVTTTSFLSSSSKSVRIKQGHLTRSWWTGMAGLTSLHSLPSGDSRSGSGDSPTHVTQVQDHSHSFALHSAAMALDLADTVLVL